MSIILERTNFYSINVRYSFTFKVLVKVLLLASFILDGEEKDSLLSINSKSKLLFKSLIFTSILVLSSLIKKLEIIFKRIGKRIQNNLYLIGNSEHAEIGNQSSVK